MLQPVSLFSDLPPCHNCMRVFTGSCTLGLEVVRKFSENFKFSIYCHQHKEYIYEDDEIEEVEYDEIK